MIEPNSFVCGDCMDYLPEYPDQYFDLAIVDPPYGDAGKVGGGHTGTGSARDSTGTRWNRFGGWFDRYKTEEPVPCLGGRFDRFADQYEPEIREEAKQKIISWDIAPGKDYFEQLFRVSKNQIIWGGNYFDLPPTRCFLIWRKTNISERFSMAMCEYAWTSFNGNAKVFDFPSQGIKGRFHPTQKPVELYGWTLAQFAKRGDRVLDTHAGSASCLLACHDAGIQYVGFEKDPRYFELADKRLKEHTAQITIFDMLDADHDEGGD